METDKETIDQSVNKILRTLELLNYIPAVSTVEYSGEQETQIKERLKALGYI